jgi:hypothetical protein
MPCQAKSISELTPRWTIAPRAQSTRDSAKRPARGSRPLGRSTNLGDALGQCRCPLGRERRPALLGLGGVPGLTLHPLERITDLPDRRRGAPSLGSRPGRGLGSPLLGRGDRAAELLRRASDLVSDQRSAPADALTTLGGTLTHRGNVLTHRSDAGSFGRCPLPDHRLALGPEPALGTETGDVDHLTDLLGSGHGG